MKACNAAASYLQNDNKWGNFHVFTKTCFIHTNVNITRSKIYYHRKRNIDSESFAGYRTNNMLSAWPCDVIQLPLLSLNMRKNIGKIRLEMECAEKCRKCSNKSTLPTNALWRKQLRIGIRQLACICQPAAWELLYMFWYKFLKDISAAWCSFVKVHTYNWIHEHI